MRVRSRAKLAGGIDLRAAALIALESYLVENVCRDFDQGDAVRGARRIAKRLSQIDLDCRPVDYSLSELRERAAHLVAVRFLKRRQPVLCRRVLASDAHDRAPGETRSTKASYGVSQAAAGCDAANARCSCGPRPSVCGISAGLLVAHVDEFDPIVAECSKNRPSVTAVDRK